MKHQMNIGELIQEELMRQERSVSWFARKLDCHRMAVYRIFSKNSIDTMLLARICEVLHCNFFKALSDEFEDSNKT